jgi:multiple sugar transport system substrate-binding protein/putative aldouronate transport system substrate-binding protein
MKRKTLSLFMSVIISTQLLSGCSHLFATSSSQSPYKDFIVVDVFDSLANLQGIQSGWFAKIVKDKFNMELNIIAPNVAGGGETLFDVRSASGSVGDLIICGTLNGDFQGLVDEGLVLDMSEMLEGKDIMRYQSAISSLNEKLTQNGIYAIPSEISSMTSVESSDGLELTYGPYLRWDIYASIGYPQMSTLEDLLSVLKEMQTVLPYTDSGNATYGFSFFKDWDANMMTGAKQPACFYGYDEIGFVLAKADGTDYQNIVASDSLYMRNLRLYNKANQMGLVDPDSSTQNYSELALKYKDGSILYSPWPWQCQSEFNTKDNTEQGKGYMLAPIDDMQIFSYGCNQTGNQKVVIAIGSQAEDPQRLADFIDWLYSPEGILISSAQNSGGAAGPEGLTWEMGDDGPYLTDFGRKAFYENGAEVPEEWGGGTWEDGVSQLNYEPVSLSDKDPNGYTYTYTLWDSVLESEYTPLDIDWRTHLSTDAISTHEYLEENNMIIVAPGTSYVESDESSDIKTIRSLCRKLIVDYSWKMVFAASDDAFNNLYQEMMKKLKAFNYEAVLAKDMQDAKAQDTARKEAAALANQ